MRAFSALTLPAFDAELLSATPGTLTRLTLLTGTLPYAFDDDDFLTAPARARITHLTLPHFVGVPPAAHEVPPAAVPRLAVLNSSPGLALAVAPGRPLLRVTLLMASTLYDGLRPAALFGALCGALKELVLVLAPDVDVHICAGGYWARWEIQVSLQALYKASRLAIAERAFTSYAPPPGHFGDRGCQVGGSIREFEREGLIGGAKHVPIKPEPNRFPSTSCPDIFDWPAAKPNRTVGVRHEKSRGELMDVEWLPQLQYSFVLALLGGPSSDATDRPLRMEGKAASYTSDKSLGLTSLRFCDMGYTAETGQN
ncbi:hypothetical protein H4582DRAFT_2082598 [Lactarius indigo]|nr:hypothetical protein H4582DRAFT_2082598 [Lactarius indigo]